MREISRRSVLLAVALGVAMTSISLGAPRAERDKEYLRISGRVLKIDHKDRTFLVSDRKSGKLYLAIVPEGATFKITFGRNMELGYPRFEHVDKHNRIEMICTRPGGERLARLDDGRMATVVTAAR